MAKLSDFVTDPKTDRYSEREVGASLAKASMTCGVIYAIVALGVTTEWLWLTYGGTMLGHEYASRRDSYKFNSAPAVAEGDKG